MKRATRATTTTTIAAVGRKRGGRSKEKGERGKESRDMLFPIHHRVLTRERRGEGEKRKKEGKQIGGVKEKPGSHLRISEQTG